MKSKQISKFIKYFEQTSSRVFLGPRPGTIHKDFNQRQQKKNSNFMKIFVFFIVVMKKRFSPGVLRRAELYFFSSFFFCCFLLFVKDFRSRFLHESRPWSVPYVIWIIFPYTFLVVLPSTIGNNKFSLRMKQHGTPEKTHLKHCCKTSGVRVMDGVDFLRTCSIL